MAKTILYGPDGQPINLTELKREQAGPTLAGVRTTMSGHPSRGLTPQRLAQLLLAAENDDPVAYLELAEEMEEKYLHYLGVIGTRKRQVSQLDFTVVPADESAEATAHADLIRSIIEDDPFQDAVFDILDAVGKGFSVTEIIWDFSERQWVPKDFQYRQPAWFAFDRENGQTLKLRDAGGQLVDMQPFKFVQHRVRAKSGLPIRGGLARPITWAFLFTNYSIKDWITFCEVYGQPLRVGKYPAGASEPEKQILLRAVSQIGSDAAAIIPASMMVDFIERKSGDTGELYERINKFFDYNVSKAVLGQTTTTDAVSGGHAVSKEHNQVREDIEKADAKALAATIKRDLIRPVIDLNFGPQKRYPALIVGRPDEDDLEQLAKSLEILVPLGLKVGMKEIRGKYGLSEPAADEELLTPPAQPVAPPRDPNAPGLNPPDPNPPEPAGTALQAQLAPSSTDVVDRFVELALPAVQPVIDTMIEQVREVLQQAASLEDVLPRLMELYPNLEAGPLGEVMSQALGASDLAGRYDVLQETGLLPEPGNG